MKKFTLLFVFICLATQVQAQFGISTYSIDHPVVTETGDKIEILFYVGITDSNATHGDFTLSGAESSPTVTALEVETDPLTNVGKLILTLSNKIAKGEEGVNLAYTQTSGNIVGEGFGNLADFVNRRVTTDSIDATAPEIMGTPTTSTTGDAIIVTFDKEIVISGNLSTSAFTVAKGTGAEAVTVGVTALSVNGKKLILTLESRIERDINIVLTYGRVIGRGSIKEKGNSESTALLGFFRIPITNISTTFAKPIITTDPTTVNTESFTVNGRTGEAEATIQLLRAGTDIMGATATADSDGIWSIDVILTEGDNVFTATAVDSSGNNKSDASNAVTITLNYSITYDEGLTPETINEDDTGWYNILEHYTLSTPSTKESPKEVQLLPNYINTDYPDWVSFHGDSIRVIPRNSEVGTHQILFRVAVNGKKKLTGTLQLTVINVNDVPAVSSKRTVARLLENLKCTGGLENDVAKTFDLSTVFSDVDVDDVLTYSIMPNGIVKNVNTIKPDFVELDVSSNNLLNFNFMPNVDYRGFYHLGIKATDKQMASITKVITLQVGSYSASSESSGFIVMTSCPIIDGSESQAGVTISETSLNIVKGDYSYYTIRLNTKPTSAVNIEITSSDEMVASVIPTFISLTSASLTSISPTSDDKNWNTPLNISVYSSGEIGSAEISHSILGASASEYTGLTVNSVDVTVTNSSPPIRKSRFVSKSISKSVILGGSAISTEGERIRERGIIYSTSASDESSLIIGGQGVSAKVMTNSIGNSFSKGIRGLATDITHYYRAYITDYNGITAYGDVKEFTLETDTADNTLGNKDIEKIGFTISPNPTDGIINITTAEKADYRLFNIRGQTLKTGVLNTGKSEINLSSFAKGIYLLNIKTSKGSFTEKIIRD